MPWGAALPRGIGVVLTDFQFLLQCLGLRLRASLVGPYSHRKGPEPSSSWPGVNRSAFSLQTLAGGQRGQPQAQ